MNKTKKQNESIDDYLPIMREEGSMAFETYDEDFDFVTFLIAMYKNRFVTIKNIKILH